MCSIQQLEARRDDVLQQMRDIRSMRRGTISEQYLKVARKGAQEPRSCGPYYVWSRRENGKTISRRLRDPAQVEQARQELDGYQRFVALCKEFEQLTEQLGELERQQPLQEKKRRRSSSSKTVKSRRS